MEFWQRVHWFFTSKCNERCRFCFKPQWDCGPTGKTEEIAKILTKEEVRQVIFTGGEPLLEKSLENGLEILKKSEVYTGIHTNATLLTTNRLDRLVSLTNEIAIPLDSTNRELQRYLRTADCLPKIKETLGRLQDKDLKIGIHTVATARNIGEIPSLYSYLCKGRFDYWRIYEFNPEIVVDKFKNVARFREIEKLRGQCATESDGGVDCLFADFVLAEDKMSKYNDKRIEFVGVRDYDRTPYFFLDSKGNTYMATWFSQKRKHIGNILEEGFSRVKDRAKKEDAKGPLYDEEDFIETEQEQPLWARVAWEGNYFTEELEEMDPKHNAKFVHLAELYLSRIKRQRKAPKDAELGFYANV